MMRVHTLKDMKGNIDAKIKELLETVQGYINDDGDAWKIAKKSDQDSEEWEKHGDYVKNVTIWCRPSSEFQGFVFKGVGTIDASPELCFKYCDPKPEGQRKKWDKAIKDLAVIEYLRKDNPEVFTLRTMTHSAAMGLISARDFVDIVINMNNKEYIGTIAQSVNSEQSPPSPDFVRGFNHACGILCYRIPGEPGKTKIYYIAQSDIGGMIPRSLVDSTLPSAIMDFFVNLRKQVQRETS